jgi:hypothetical protein
MMNMVSQLFEEFDSHKLNRIWLTHQSCLNEIIEDDGGNNYNIPHLNKARLEREGTLPEVLEVTPAATPLLVELGEL